MALRYRPASAGPLLTQTGEHSARVKRDLNRLFSTISYLEEDRQQIYYRKAYYSVAFATHRKTINSVYGQCSFGKTHRSFGAFYDLYLLQMNNLNFHHALNGPGIEYKDGKLARMYINRIIDSSQDMLAELAKIEEMAVKLQEDFATLPRDFDEEWGRRYNHLFALIQAVRNDIDECQEGLELREDSANELLYAWFPEEAEDNEMAMSTSSLTEEAIPSAQSQADPNEGTEDNPYLLLNVIDSPHAKRFDVTRKLHNDQRGAKTYFRVEDLPAGVWEIRFSTQPAQDWDTHVTVITGGMMSDYAGEKRIQTPHTHKVDVLRSSDHVDIRVEAWEQRNRDIDYAWISIKKLPAQEAEDEDEPIETGAKETPYIIEAGERENILANLKTSRRGEATFFKFNVPKDTPSGTVYNIKFTTSPNQDWDTHVRAREGERTVFARQETYQWTPHKLIVVPNYKTDNFEIELQYWEHSGRPNFATLEVTKAVFVDDGGL